MNARQIIGTMDGQQVVGLDIAKQVLQLHTPDASDARAIWLAVQPPGVKFVGMKTVAQQATPTLHRQRELLMKMRTMGHRQPARASRAHQGVGPGHLGH